MKRILYSDDEIEVFVVTEDDIKRLVLECVERVRFADGVTIENVRRCILSYGVMVSDDTISRIMRELGL